MKTAIAGMGEVGNSLYCVLNKAHSVWTFNESSSKVKLHPIENEPFYILHICFPYFEGFEKEVEEYKKILKPSYTVIHSTVPLGTSRRINAVHHPITGMHPNLEQSFLTFTQFLSGKEASSVADYFRRCGMKVYLFDKQETTELGKISQTTFYGVMIEYVKELKRECDEKGLSFTEVYTMMSQAYNEGYEKLNREEYKMPLLTPIMKKQGGHCVLQNCELWDNKFTKLIKELNEETG